MGAPPPSRAKSLTVGRHARNERQRGRRPASPSYAMYSSIRSRYHVYALPRNVHNAGENSPKHAVQTAGLCQLAEELLTSLRRHRARSRMPWVYDRGQPVDKCIPF